MARNRTLAQLVSDLRLEIGSTNSVSVGADHEENVKQLLRRTQELLYDDYDWPHLKLITSKSIVAGSRYYDMPANLNFDRINRVSVLYGGTYLDLTRGIGFDEYSCYDPANDERADPVQRWDVKYTGSTDQIEFWPLPAAAQTVYFEGIRDLPDLTSDSDRAVLDDKMIVLHVAAEMLAKAKSANAGAVQTKAQQRYDRVKSNSKADGARFQLGLGRSRSSISGPTVVQVAS